MCRSVQFSPLVGLMRMGRRNRKVNLSPSLGVPGEKRKETARQERGFLEAGSVEQGEGTEDTQPGLPEGLQGVSL